MSISASSRKTLCAPFYGSRPLTSLAHMRGMLWLSALFFAAAPASIAEELLQPVHAVVLPESAFLEALGSQHFQPDRATANEAIRLGALANTPGTLGIRAGIKRG